MLDQNPNTDGSLHHLSRCRSADWPGRQRAFPGEEHALTLQRDLCLSPNRTACSYRPAVRFPDSCCRRVSALRRPDSGSWEACCCCSRRADAAVSRHCSGTSPCSSGTLSRASSLSSRRNLDPAEVAKLLPIWSGSMNTWHRLQSPPCLSWTAGADPRGLSAPAVGKISTLREKVCHRGKYTSGHGLQNTSKFVRNVLRITSHYPFNRDTLFVQSFTIIKCNVYITVYQHAALI